MHTPLLLLLFFLSISAQFSSCQKLEAQDHTVEDAFKALGISWNKDGTLNRQIWIPMVDPTPSEDAKPTPKALSTDIPLSPYSKAYIRLYIPVNPPKKKKLPLIIYFHGGDFVLFSASTVIFHNFCNDIASEFPAVVASVEYRLAPEHRLPAAYEDAVNGILWARDQALEKGGRDPWMEYADFSRVFLMGSSAGGNIALQAAIRAMDYDTRPLEFKGLMMNQPLFGSYSRSRSEIRLIDDPYCPPYVTDVIWNLSLPVGADKNHPFSNPFGFFQGKIYKLPKVYIKGYYGDPLVDREFKIAQHICNNCRVPVFYHFEEGGHHGIELVNKTAAQELYDEMRYFVNTISYWKIRNGTTISSKVACNDLSSEGGSHASI